ncbi:hypothetical protein [Kutzneria buriramensis]|uniref:Uncharacterized protein n=1 Tax=Kutzneria buriramensis TaxID=1045776 RepID=A0A3E0GV27_9PSEU|nr:hypothetical protein [Kutzneria buriramensis]REH29468.1 hypothetical protein BCF44_12583 [Kutzneria buriramensis]
MTDPIGAAERYKEITGWIGDAVQEMREQDAERGVVLTTRLEDAMESTNEMLTRADESMSRIDDWWQRAVGELFHERWMQVTPLPRPDTSVPPRPLEFYEAEVERAYGALIDAIRRRGILPRR